MKKFAIILLLVSLIFGDDIFDQQISERGARSNFSNSLGGSLGLMMGENDSYQPIETGIGLAFGLEYRRAIYNSFILGLSYQYLREYNGTIFSLENYDFTSRRHCLILKPQIILSEEEDKFQIYLGGSIGYSTKKVTWNKDSLGDFEDRVESMIYGGNLEIKHYLHNTYFVTLSFDLNHYTPFSSSRKKLKDGSQPADPLDRDPLLYDPIDGTSSSLKITIGKDF